MVISEVPCACELRSMWFQPGLSSAPGSKWAGKQARFELPRDMGLGQVDPSRSIMLAQSHRMELETPYPIL